MRVRANQAPWDRALRIAVGLGLLAVAWTGVAGGLLAVACQLFGWVPLVTGIVGWDPLYAMLGTGTVRRHGGRH